MVSERNILNQKDDRVHCKDIAASEARLVQTGGAPGDQFYLYKDSDGVTKAKKERQ